MNPKKDKIHQTPETAKAIGRTIAKRRQQSNLTQEQVAEQLGIGYEAVSRMERGIVIPTVERLIELAEVFNCQAAEFLSEASLRPTDQANHLSQLLSELNDSDRQMVIGILETLVERLKVK